MFKASLWGQICSWTEAKLKLWFLDFPPRLMFSKQELNSKSSKLALIPQWEILPRASGLYHEASDLLYSSHKQMNTKSSSLLANSEAYASYLASPPHTNPHWEHQRLAGGYWGGQGKGKGCLMQRKDAQVSRALATSSFLPRNISVSPTCNCRITGMIWKCSLVCYSLVLHLRFSGLGRNRWNPVYLTFHSKLARVCCVVGEQGFNHTLRFEEAPPVPLRNVTDIQALEDNSDTLQLMKMIMEVPENLHSTGILQTALSCALPTLQLLSNC